MLWIVLFVTLFVVLFVLTLVFFQLAVDGDGFFEKAFFILLSFASFVNIFLLPCYLAGIKVVGYSY